jgi:hypothetical protein
VPSAKQTSLLYRNEVIEFLRSQGFWTADGPAGTLDIDNPQEGNGGSVAGLPWTLVTRKRLGETAGIGLGLNSARDLAAQQENPLFATVFHRRGTSVEDSYVVLPLHVLADVLARLYPELLGKKTAA